MTRIFDYLVLSCLLAVMFAGYGYIFTTAGMICLYSTVYAMFEGDNKSSS